MSCCLESDFNVEEINKPQNLRVLSPLSGHNVCRLQPS